MSSDNYIKENKILALFDFDGTITSKDTLILFLKYTQGNFKYYRGLFFLSPFLIAYKLKLYPNYKAKQILLSWFFKNLNYGEFKRKGEFFCAEILPNYIREAALKKIKWHQKKQHRIVLVTASVEEWVAPWCNEVDIEYICTRLEVKDNYLTGKFSTANCFGVEKVNRIKSMINLSDYDTIYAYGDSSGDKDLLSIATKPFYRHFED